MKKMFETEKASDFESEAPKEEDLFQEKKDKKDEASVLKEEEV